MEMSEPEKTSGKLVLFTKENMAISVSFIALFLTILGQYLPYYNASGRIEPYLGVLTVIEQASVAACDQQDSTLEDCELVYGFGHNGGFLKVKSALELERSYLSASKYWELQGRLDDYKTNKIKRITKLKSPDLYEAGMELEKTMSDLYDKVNK